MMSAWWLCGAVPIVAGIAVGGCTADAPSELAPPRESTATGLRLECVPARVIRAQDVACTVRGAGDTVEVTRWTFTNDEGSDLPPVVRPGEGPGDTIWAGPVAVGGVVEVNLRIPQRLFGHFEVLPRW
jgi:hypothetical protein